MVAGKTSRRLRYRGVLCALAGAGVAAAVLLSQTAFFQLLHLKARDLHFLLRGKRATAGVVLIAIDQKSLDSISEPLLFWHPYYSAAIRAAAEGGAKVFGLDVTFAIPVDKWEKDLDRDLAAAVIENQGRMPVICPYIQGTLGSKEAASVPLNMLVGSLGLAALANLSVDRDDFVRETVLSDAPDPSGAAPPLRGFALRMAEAFTGAAAELKDGEVYLGGRHIPAAAPRVMTINFAGPAGTIPRVSLYQFLDAARRHDVEQLKRWVNGKAVLLGMDYIEDRHATPYYILSQGTRANTAGVEIQASALDTILQRKFLVGVPEWVRWSALILFALLAAVAAGTMKGKRLAGVLAAEGAGAILIAHVAFLSGWLLSDSEILMAGVLSVVPVVAYRSLWAERRGSLFQKAVAVFVGGQLADALDASESISRSGKRTEVTILFSDIRGFTAFCESKDPAVVVDLLNTYMETMVAIIVKHGGQVNKFIGDGIMAIFSDEDAGSRPGDHAERAVRCGCEMVQAPSDFKTGTGIHSGVVVVGVVGSADKMEYTALGDTVNLASRLESLNKEHKTQLLMSEETRRRLPESLEAFCLGEVQVRGKAVPMKIYTAAELRVASVKV